MGEGGQIHWSHGGRQARRSTIKINTLRVLHLCNPLPSKYYAVRLQSVPAEI